MISHGWQIKERSFKRYCSFSLRSELLFELTRCPSRALILDLYITSGPTSEIQRHHQVWRNRHIGPRTPITTGANLGCVSNAKHTCFHFSKKNRSPPGPPWPPFMTSLSTIYCSVEYYNNNTAALWADCEVVFFRFSRMHCSFKHRRERTYTNFLC